ncbi:hypothetical protein BGZ89_011399, partial [Linnemannia elongata]
FYQHVATPTLSYEEKVRKAAVRRLTKLRQRGTMSRLQGMNFENENLACNTKEAYSVHLQLFQWSLSVNDVSHRSLPKAVEHED